MRVIVIWEYVLENWAYRLLLAAGHLGQAAKSSCCLLPVGPFLLHLLLMRVLHDFALSRFWRRGNGRLNVNKISFHSHVVQPAAASTLVRASLSPYGGGEVLPLSAGRGGWAEGLLTDMMRDHPHSHISFRGFKVKLCNFTIRFNNGCCHMTLTITSVMLSFFPLLPVPSTTKYSRSVALSEYIPPAKIHRPCFLNLAQWSVCLEWKCSERRSHGAQHGWLRGKVMTMSACVFGGCETTAENSPDYLRCNFLLLLTSEEHCYWLLLGCEPSRSVLASGPLFMLSVCNGSSWRCSTEGEL